MTPTISSNNSPPKFGPALSHTTTIADNTTKNGLKRYLLAEGVEEPCGMLATHYTIAGHWLLHLMLIMVGDKSKYYRKVALPKSECCHLQSLTSCQSVSSSREADDGTLIQHFFPKQHPEQIIQQVLTKKSIPFIQKCKNCQICVHQKYLSFEMNCEQPDQWFRCMKFIPQQ